MFNLPPVAVLATLLHSASEAHHEYERTHGPDPDWWHWYAAYMTAHAEITITPNPDRLSHIRYLAACCPTKGA